MFAFNFNLRRYMKDALRREQLRTAADAAANAAGAAPGLPRPKGARNMDVDERSVDYVMEVITHYATSLRYGHRHVYEVRRCRLTLSNPR